jgi:hypothetical protein
MAADAIQDLLGRARAWSPNAARELAAHLADAPRRAHRALAALPGVLATVAARGRAR